MKEIIANNIIDQLIDRIDHMKNPSCIGLDTTLELIPQEILEREIGLRWNTPKAAASAITSFNESIIDIIHSIVPVIKINIAMYEKYGPPGIEAYIETIRYAKNHDMIVIGDVKRGDVDSISKHYSEGHLGLVNICGVEQPIYNTDFITGNAYLGYNSVLPFIKDCEKYNKGMFLLVKTSNKGSGDIQDLRLYNPGDPGIPGHSLYWEVCFLVDEWGDSLRGRYGFSSVGAVVGAIHPIQLQSLRKDFPNLFFLVPDYDPQSGGILNVLPAFRNKDKMGALINNSSGILGAHQKDTYVGMHWKDAIYQMTIEMRDSLRRGLEL